MTDEEIKKRIQEAFGYSDEQLLLEFEKAKKETKDNAADKKLGGRGEYQTLKRKIEEYEKGKKDEGMRRNKIKD